MGNRTNPRPPLPGLANYRWESHQCDPQPRRWRDERGAERRSGTITAWRVGATSGFITGDDGMSWFVSLDETPDHIPLGIGERVQFTGRPKPQTGKRYPYA